MENNSSFEKGLWDFNLQKMQLCTFTSSGESTRRLEYCNRKVDSGKSKLISLIGNYLAVAYREILSKGYGHPPNH